MKKSTLKRAFTAAAVAVLITAGCSDKNPVLPPDSYDLPDTPEEFHQPGYFEELYHRNERLVAQFDFEEFSVWFSIKPILNTNNNRRWDFTNGANSGIPITVAVVKNVEGRSELVEELKVNLDLRLNEWAFEKMPNRLPTMQNFDLKPGEGYMYTNFFDTYVFTGYEHLRRQAIAVATSDTFGLFCQWPTEDESGAAGEYLIGIKFGEYSDNNNLRYIMLGKDGVIFDYSAVTKADYQNMIYTLEEFDFLPETQTLTLGRITASPTGIFEQPSEAVFNIFAEGEIYRTDNISGLSAKTLTSSPQGGAVIDGAGYPFIAGAVYHFPFRDLYIDKTSVLRYDSFDIHTRTQKTGELFYDFGSETVTKCSQTEQGLKVSTDAAEYFFDDELEMTKRISAPSNTYDRVFNRSFTKMAFRGDIGGVWGTYLIDLESAAPPVLVAADVPIDFERGVDSAESIFPIRFIDDERLFVGVFVWEESFFRILDLSGNVLEQFPFYASGMLGGGQCYSNDAMVIFLPMNPEQGPHYYNFESRALSPADWWTNDERVDWDYYVSDLENPYIWYVCAGYFDRAEHPRNLEKSEILRLDFENRTVRPLIGFPGTRTAILSVGQNREIVFAYANNADYGFAVYTPEKSPE